MVELTRQFALFKQTILNDTRSLGLQILRFAFIAVLAFFMITLVEQMNSRSWMRQVDGRYYFEFIFVINIFFVASAALFLFLPIVREEKEENTLGMILMTGISPFAYLFGKVGSRYFIMILMMAVQIPITYLCVTMGGIDINTIFFSYLLLLLIAFHIGNAFLLSSLIGTSVISCILIAGGIILIVSFILNIIFNEIFVFSNYEEPFRLVELALRDIFESRNTSIGSQTISFFLSLFGTGSIYFLVAVYYFNSLTADQKEIELPRNLKGIKASDDDAVKLSEKGVKRLVRTLKTKRFGKYPVIYKDFRFSCYGPMLYILQFVLIAGSISLCFMDTYWWSYYRPESYIEALIRVNRDLLPFICFSLFGIVMISSNLVFSHEIKNNTLGSLLLLPQEPSRLFIDKLICIVRISAPLIFMFGLSFFSYHWNRDYGNSERFFKEFYLFLVILIPGLFLNVWMSLISKRYSFFISNGITFGFFAVQFMFFDIFRINMGEGLVFLSITGYPVTALAINRALKKLSAHSITS